MHLLEKALSILFPPDPGRISLTCPQRGWVDHIGIPAECKIDPFYGTIQSKAWTVPYGSPKPPQAIRQLDLFRC